jgi:hypothetical protein
LPFGVAFVLWAWAELQSVLAGLGHVIALLDLRVGGWKVSEVLAVGGGKMHLVQEPICRRVVGNDGKTDGPRDDLPGGACAGQRSDGRA